MYAVDPVASVTQNTAKSCIQALLKTRELQQISTISQKYSQRNIGHFSGGFAIESQVSDFTDNINSHEELNSRESISPDNVDNLNDFNYSQKLFHIADGNLYSIFSPIQGRSYGMKPSFLRKQKYTVQECHSRGRKNMRKGLKFHNFLPSESVTSEKDNGFLRTKWKVHSECRLREEHGTKQITISNWSQSIQNSAEDPLLQNSQTTSNSVETLSSEPASESFNIEKKIHIKKIACDNDPYDFNLQTNSPSEKPVQNSIEAIAETKRQSLVKSANSKKGSLRFVLNSLLDRPVVSENSACSLPNAHSKFQQNLKHRRKPVQTRRVVPYTKYLSLMEEDESSPLDLSSKCSEDKCHNSVSHEEILTLDKISESSSNSLCLTDSNKLLKNVSNLSLDSVPNSNLNLTASNGDIFVNSSSLAHLLQNQMASPLVLLSAPINNPLNVRQFPEPSKVLHKSEMMEGKHKINLNTNQIKIKGSYPSPHTNSGPSFSGNMQYTVHKSFIKNSGAKTRRRSQRSVIKKNLEDTFRQNGFLVKTKQVSDGEATFCKFRQLRKYTRYYLKSWQQHLPDEVHKMWKGFLPPKTVLPPLSGVSESTNEAH